MAVLVVQLVQSVYVDIDAHGVAERMRFALVQVLFKGAAVKKSRDLIGDAHAEGAAPRRGEIPDHKTKIAQQQRVHVAQRHAIKRRVPASASASLTPSTTLQLLMPTGS